MRYLYFVMVNQIVSKISIMCKLICILKIKFGRHMYDRIIWLRWRFRPSKASLFPLLFIEVPIPSKESGCDVLQTVFGFFCLPMQSMSIKIIVRVLIRYPVVVKCTQFNDIHFLSYMKTARWFLSVLYSPASMIDTDQNFIEKLLIVRIIWRYQRGDPSTIIWQRS